MPQVQEIWCVKKKEMNKFKKKKKKSAIVFMAILTLPLTKARVNRSGPNATPLTERHVSTATYQKRQAVCHVCMTHDCKNSEK